MLKKLSKGIQMMSSTGAKLAVMCIQSVSVFI